MAKSIARWKPMSRGHWSPTMGKGEFIGPGAQGLVGFVPSFAALVVLPKNPTIALILSIAAGVATTYLTESWRTGLGAGLGTLAGVGLMSLAR